MENNPVTNRIWNEWLEKDKELSLMSKEERLELCMDYQWIFPMETKRSVELESLYSSVHWKHNREEFKRWFYVVCGYMCSRIHLGDSSYYQYKKIFKKQFRREKCTSDDFPSQVLLVLGMLGYITELELLHSNTTGGKNNHGYHYHIDREKLITWDSIGTVSISSFPDWVMNTTSTVSFQEEGVDTDRISWTMHPDWLADRQYQSISSVEVVKEGLVESSRWMFNYNEYQYYYHLSDKEQEDLKKTWVSYQKLRDLDCGIIGGCLDDSKKPDGKGYAGRFYSPMTNMKSEHRQMYLRLDGEKVTEVDVSAAQPTFLGVMMYRETGVMSEWLRQCLNKTSDFYEWIKEKTNTQEDRKTIKKWMMQYMYSCYQPNKKKDYDKPHKPTYENRKTDDPFLCFQQRLNKFLMENEPAIYNKIDYYKRYPVYREDKIIYKIYPDEFGNKNKKSVGKGKWCSMLSYYLVCQEVSYIKRCIHSLPEDLKFWTIHDCICVPESRSKEVKSIMEKVSREMYGKEITLKLKRENTSDINS